MRLSLRAIALLRASTVLRTYTNRLSSRSQRPPHATLLTACGVVGAGVYAGVSGTVLAFSEYADTASLTWGKLVSRLSSVSGDITHRKRTTNNGARYELTIGASRSADIHAVLATVLDFFCSDKVDVKTAEAPSSTTLILNEGPYTVEILKSRIAAFDSRVTLTVDMEGGIEPQFSDNQVQALIRTAKVVSTPQYTIAQDDSPLTFDEDGQHIGCRNPYISDEEAKVTKARSTLAELGVDIVEPSHISEKWDAIAGYDDVKRRIQDTLVLPLKHPSVYESVVRSTRERFQSNVPKAVLYSGPPGCGKTLSARILASTIGVPFVHVPLEGLLSKYYGETTRKLASILEAANDLGRCIVFIDEADSLAQSRSGEVHEVSRRTLSVLLRFLDGIDGPRDAILLAATNCADDIDAALLSRFDVVIEFPLPDLQTREDMLKLYAKQLNDNDRKLVAMLADGFSGREILDVCEEAERSYTGRVVRGDSDAGGVPEVQDYTRAVRAKAAMSVNEVQKRNKAKRAAKSGSAPRVAIAG